MSALVCGFFLETTVLTGGMMVFLCQMFFLSLAGCSVATTVFLQRHFSLLGLGGKDACLPLPAIKLSTF